MHHTQSNSLRMSSPVGTDENSNFHGHDGCLPDRKLARCTPRSSTVEPRTSRVSAHTLTTLDDPTTCRLRGPHLDGIDVPPATSLAHVSPQRIPPKLQGWTQCCILPFTPQLPPSVGAYHPRPTRHPFTVRRITRPRWLMYSPTLVSLLAHLVTPEISVSPTHQHVTDADNHVQISKWVSEQSRTHWTSDNAQFQEARGTLLLPSLRRIVSPLLRALWLVCSVLLVTGVM